MFFKTSDIFFRMFNFFFLMIWDFPNCFIFNFQISDCGFSYFQWDYQSFYYYYFFNQWCFNIFCGLVQKIRLWILYFFVLNKLSNVIFVAQKLRIFVISSKKGATRASSTLFKNKKIIIRERKNFTTLSKDLTM